MYQLPYPSPGFLLSPHATAADFVRYRERVAEVQAFNLDQMRRSFQRQHDEQMAKQRAMEAAHADLERWVEAFLP